MPCKRQKCQLLGRCATVDENGNSDCFGDASLSGERNDADYDAGLARMYVDGKRLPRDAALRAKRWLRANR